MTTTSESKAFSQRLRDALEACGVRLSPSVVSNEFNLRYWGRSITSHTARNWLMGNSMPTQDKLRVLAEWLQVSPDALRFGSPPGGSHEVKLESITEALNLADKEMLHRYLALAVANRKIVRDVVEALFVAASVKREQ